MGDLMPIRPEQGALMPEEAAREMRRMGEALETMAAMLRATTDMMEQLRRQVALLEKVTPGQARALNAAIRERASEVCGLYMAKGAEKRAAAAIRKSLRTQFGATSMGQLPRCDYEVALEAVRQWDDYGTMTAIRKGGGRG